MDNLLGVLPTTWLRLLWENRFSIDKAYRKGAVQISLNTLLTTRGYFRERRRYGRDLDRTEILPPVFLIGHWRSGTTLLHNLLSIDRQFAWPNLFQVSHPHTCLVREHMVERALQNRRSIKRDMDNVEVTFRSPGEDESALAMLCGRSPYLAWTFPRNTAFYDRYLTMQDVSGRERRLWEATFVGFLKKLTFRYGKTLLLKSPPHTARIAILMRLFPGARFIHIVRNPYRVFQSTRRLYETVVLRTTLQALVEDGINDGILSRYEAMYDAFFRERGLIPRGQYHEMRCEDLERDPVGHVKAAYDALSLEGFGGVEQALRGYVASLKGYKKSEHPNLPDPLRESIAARWARTFKEWGYGD